MLTFYAVYDDNGWFQGVELEDNKIRGKFKKITICDQSLFQDWIDLEIMIDSLRRYSTSKINLENLEIDRLLTSSKKAIIRNRQAKLERSNV